MNRNNFIGLSGFVWWVGEIEARVDPLGIGRCKVRIFGWHTDNKALLPTKDLPWAHPMIPVNNSDTYCAPELGEWVVGFFMDGESGQAPVMMGVLPAINSNATPEQKQIDIGIEGNNNYVTLTPEMLAENPDLESGI